MIITRRAIPGGGWAPAGYSEGCASDAAAGAGRERIPVLLQHLAQRGREGAVPRRHRHAARAHSGQHPPVRAPRFLPALPLLHRPARSLLPRTRALICQSKTGSGSIPLFALCPGRGLRPPNRSTPRPPRARARAWRARRSSAQARHMAPQPGGSPTAAVVSAPRPQHIFWAHAAFFETRFSSIQRRGEKRRRFNRPAPPNPRRPPLPSRHPRAQRSSSSASCRFSAATLPPRPWCERASKQQKK